MRGFGGLVRAIILLTAVAGRAVAGQEFVVDSLEDLPDVFPGSGVCFTTAGTCTFRAALQEANALPGQDTIVVGPGIHELTIAGDGEDAAATGDLDVTDDLIVEGGAAETSVIESRVGDRVFDVAADVNFTLADVSVCSGFGNPAGGGVRAADGALVFLARTRFERNVALEEGGAIALLSSGPDGATLLAFESAFLLNLAGIPNLDPGRGGAIHASGLASVQLLDTELVANEAVWAPALWSDFGPVTIERSTLAGHGSSNATVAVSNTTQPVRIENSTISGNQSGLAILASIQGGPISILNSTIVANQAPYTIAVLTGFGSVSLRNSVLFNTATEGECAGGAVSLGHNATPAGPEGYCAPLQPSDQIVDDPLLGPLGDNGGDTLTHLPLSGSPLVDAGDDASCPALDQRGRDRPEDGDRDGSAGCDIGSVEVPESEGLAAGALAALGILASRARRRARATPRV